MAGADLAGGLDFLLAQAGRAKFAWLSANLVEPASGHPLFTPFLSRQVGETRVAVIGITGELPPGITLPAGQAALRPWAESLAPLVAELERSHDFLVLLTDLPPTVCGAVARRFPAVNLIINAAGDTYNQPPRTLAPTTLLAATGRQGKYVGALEVTWSRGGRWGEGQDRYLALRDKLEELQRTSARLAELGGRPEQESQSGNLRRRQALLQEEIDEMRRGLAGVAVAFFANSFQPMSAAVGEEARTTAIVARVREKIAALGRKNAAASLGPVVLPGFAGWRACGGCHPAATARWESTGHAGAYATLEKKNRQFNGACLPCHVTGSEYVGADRIAFLPPELQGVGCEVCHGPGQAHAGKREKVRSRRVPANLCQGCHLPEHDGDFDYARDLEKIRCDR